MTTLLILMCVFGLLAFAIPAKADGEGGGSENDKKTDGGENPEKPTVTFTPEQQAYVDQIIGERISREKRAMKKEFDEKVETERKKAEMDENARLKAEKEESDRKASEAVTKAQKILLQAKAETTLLAAGVKPDRLQAAMKLLDLSEVKYDQDTETVDLTSLQKQVTEFTKAYPEWVGNQGSSSSGGTEFKGGQAGDKPLSEDVIANMSDEEMRRRMPEITQYYASKGK